MGRLCQLLMSLLGQKKEYQQDLLITLEPIESKLEEPTIVLEALRDDRPITLEQLRDAWPQAIKRVKGLDQRLKENLEARTHALTFAEGIVEFFVDDDELLSALQEPLRISLEDALIEVLGVKVPFRATKTLIIEDEEVRQVEEDARLVGRSREGDDPNWLDIQAQSFFEGSGLFPLFNPTDRSVYSLSAMEDGVELDWFQIGPATERDLPRYIDVFCLLPKSSPEIEQYFIGLNNQDVQYREQFLLRMIQGLPNITENSLDAVFKQVSHRLSQEPVQVARNIFFLIVPRFPEDGIHVLTRPFDLTSLTAIPLDVSSLVKAQFGSQCSDVLRETFHYWSKRINRYFRTDPVTGLDYYRRDDIEVRVRNHIERGQSFGLFGPRRMGKSSILREMKRKDAFGQALVCLLDMQAFAGRTLWATFPEAMRMWLSYLGDGLVSKDGFSLTKMTVSPGTPVDQGLIKQEIMELVKRISDGTRLVLILDEVGEILPYPPDYQHVSHPEWRDFLKFLRALYFETDRKFVLGVAAYGSDIVYNDFGATDKNPWLRGLDAIAVGPLSRVDCDRMIQDIGAMTGAYFKPEVLDLLYINTGGHPQITRELCSIMAEQIKERPHVVEPTEINSVIEQYITDNETTRSMFRHLAPKEKQIVLKLANAKEINVDNLFSELGQHFEDEVDFDDYLKRLDKYGLIQIENGSRSVHLRFGLFRKYLVGLPHYGEKK